MLQTYLILIVDIMLMATANLLLRRGMMIVGPVDISFSQMAGLFLKVFLNPYLLGGLFSYGIAFLLWLTVLSRLQLNIAYPISISLGVVLIVFMSWLINKEHISTIQIFGIFFIVAGIILLVNSKS